MILSNFMYLGPILFIIKEVSKFIGTTFNFHFIFESK